MAVSFLFFAALGAQEPSNTVFAPFISRLTVTADSARVVLTWKNSEDLYGYKQLFRAETEISDRTIRGAVMLARLAPDIESYIDTPPANRDVFYAVLLEDKDGDLYQVFIPFRNISHTAVRLEESPATVGPSVAAVTGITAEVTGDSITVRFASSDKTRNLILYRSTSPLRAYADLTQAGYSLLLTPGADRLKDVPLPGVNYYYAILDTAALNSGKAEFKTGENTTAAPVQIPLGGEVARVDSAPRRVFPLPAPHVLYSLETGEELLPPLPFLLPQSMPLSPAAADLVDSLISRIKRPPAPLSFTLLPIEEAANLEGEDRLLQTVVKEVAPAADSPTAVEKLSGFLQTHHSAAVEARARYYLGQSYCVRGQFREALLEFVFAREMLYLETQPWIDACLSGIETVP